MVNMVRMAAGLISYYLTDSEVTQVAQVLYKQVLDEVRTGLVPMCGVEPLTDSREAAAAAATGPNSMGMLRRGRGPFLPGDQTRENPPQPPTHTPTCNASVSHLPLYRRPSGEGRGGGVSKNKTKNIQSDNNNSRLTLFFFITENTFLLQYCTFGFQGGAFEERVFKGPAWKI